MLILSHRGCWNDAEEKNGLQAFERSFAVGFGTETDIRDCLGSLVISHDMPDAQRMSVDVFFQAYHRIGRNLPLALNIKADGLQQELKKLLHRHRIENYFVFDMSVPDALGYLKHGINIFTRQSEYETSPPFYEDAKGVWVDCFLDDWADEEILAHHLWRGKRVCLVSPELHGRDHRPFWQELAKMTIVDDVRLMLCTDYPVRAREFFDD